MMNKKTVLLIYLGILLIPFGPSCKAQEYASPYNFELFIDHPALSIDRAKVETAISLTDLNKHFKSSWVKEYYKVNLQCPVEGKLRNVPGSNDTLSNKQLSLLRSCDKGVPFEIDIDYLPQNTLIHNEPKHLSYEILIRPETKAILSDTEQSFKEYITENAIQKIALDQFAKYKVAMVSFTIDSAGYVSDVSLKESSKDASIDKILLDAICNMPNWKSANYNNQTKISQNFVLAVGHMESCSLNQINRE